MKSTEHVRCNRAVAVASLLRFAKCSIVRHAASTCSIRASIAAQVDSQRVFEG